MRTLLIEGFGGLAGDMFLAACLDLGDPRFELAALQDFAERWLPGAVSLRAQRVTRGALSALHLDVLTRESAFARGAHEAVGAGAAAAPPADPGLRPLELGFHELPLASAAPQRGLAELLAEFERAPLGAAGRARGAAIARRIAAAEARVHGLSVDAVHFHELGALDTLIDVGGALFALERLGVERVIATPPLAGAGTLRCAHGELPVPAPGTLELLQGIAYRRGGSGERLTPTGAALLAEFAGPQGVGEHWPAFAPERTGYGAGTRDPADGPPNVARVELGELRGAPQHGEPARTEAWLFECNLDDATGEEIGFLLEQLRNAGALEAWSSAVQMKKDRPGALVSALAREGARAALEAAAFAHSPTLGLRWTRLERRECAREQLLVELDGQRVRVQCRRRPAAALEALDLSPEFDDLAALARHSGRPLRELERAAVELALLQLRGRA